MQSYSLLLFTLPILTAPMFAQTIPYDGYDVQIRVVQVEESTPDRLWAAANRQAALHHKREIRAPKGQKLLIVNIGFERNASLPEPTQMTFEKSSNIFNPRSVAQMPFSAFSIEATGGETLAWAPLASYREFNESSPLAGGVIEIAMRRGSGRRDVDEAPMFQTIAFDKNFAKGWTNLIYAVPPGFDPATITVRLNGQAIPRRPAKQK